MVVPTDGIGKGQKGPWLYSIGNPPGLPWIQYLQLNSIPKNSSTSPKSAAKETKPNCQSEYFWQVGAGGEAGGQARLCSVI